jgi:hypothetical protein
MTTMIPRFFGVPQELIRHGALASLGGVAVKLYVSLWHESERYCTRELLCSTATLKKLTGCSRNALMKARGDLSRLGLVRIESCSEKGFVVHLCDLKTGQPWPGHPKRQIEYRKKDRAPSEVPKTELTIEEPQSNHFEKKNLPSRPGSSTIERRASEPILSAQTSDDFTDGANANYEACMSGTSFPFGHNAPNSSLTNVNSFADSLRRVFD